MCERLSSRIDRVFVAFTGDVNEVFGKFFSTFFASIAVSNLPLSGRCDAGLSRWLTAWQCARAMRSRDLASSRLIAFRQLVVVKAKGRRKRTLPLQLCAGQIRNPSSTDISLQISLFLFMNRIVYICFNALNKCVGPTRTLTASVLPSGESH